MRKLFIILLLLLLPMTAGAKDLFVDIDGIGGACSDATTRANNLITAPWCTVSKALTTAESGDKVYFRAGIYPITSEITPSNSGADADNRIEVTRYNTETATWDSDILLGVIDQDGTSYWYYHHLDFTGNANTWFNQGEDVPANYNWFKYNTVKQDMGSTSGANTFFVNAIGRSAYTEITNNELTGPCSSGDCTGVDSNTAGIYMGHSTLEVVGAKVLNNLITDYQVGIYYKHGYTSATETGNEVAYNYITNCPRYSMETNSRYLNVHDNLMGVGNGNLRINESNGGPDGDLNTINHNTLFSGGIFLSTDDTGADNNTITNNIMASYTNCCDGNTWDYNIYESGAAIGGNDLGNTSPTYVAGANPSTIAGYALTAESAGYLAGSDSKDMGADVSLVGPDAPDPTIRSSTYCSGQFTRN